jgi:multidrug efflux pump subunit AcrA (membrane-fusion protein)
MGRLLGWIILMAVGVAVGVALTPIIEATRPVAPNADEPTALRQPIERRTLREELVTRARVDGGSPTPLYSPASGIVTDLSVAVGDRVEEGQVVATVNDVPIVAVNGEGSFWRPLSVGHSGPDVMRLQELLVDRGLLAQADGRYGGQTAAAVERWSKSVGHPRPGGIFDPASVLIAEWPKRVTALHVDVGSSVNTGSEVLTVVDDSYQVTLSLSPNDVGLVAVGNSVELRTVEDSVLTGVIESVDELPLPNEDGDLEYSAVVAIDDGSGLVIGSQLSAVVVLEESANTLAAPLSAVVVGQSGGPALRVVQEDGSSAVVDVDLGLVDPPWVEVIGPLGDGDIVEVVRG